MKSLIGLLLWLSSLLHVAHAAFSERLTLRPLPAINQVLGRFDFSIGADASLVPNVLRQILEKHDAESLHLTFSVGRYADWRYGSAQDFNGSGFAHAPFGTRLQVALRGNAGVPQRWQGITAELGGIFSASLSQMDQTVVTELMPMSTPQEMGAFPFTTTIDPALVFLHGSLAREELCTENLTPWLKMLPCRAVSGLGALIDPINALSGEYLSLSLFVARASDGQWTLRQQLTTVQSPSKHNNARWSLGSIFFANEQPTDVAACPLATESVIYTEDMRSAGTEIVDLREKPVSLANPWFENWKSAAEKASGTARYKTQEDVVSVHRFVTGYGQVHGGIAVQLKNNHPSCGMQVTYHDVLPWYLRVYFHTFRAAVGGNEERAQELIQAFNFVPAELRGRPNQMRLEAFLPANTTLVFSLQMEKAFLRLSEHPPDANRGFDIASGVATFGVPSDTERLSTCGKDLTSSSFTTTLFTEPLLVPLPTPDFSMPYNVITMTSTVVAFFVGTILNALLRKAPRLKQMMTSSSK